MSNRGRNGVSALAAASIALLILLVGCMQPFSGPAGFEQMAGTEPGDADMTTGTVVISLAGGLDGIRAMTLFPEASQRERIQYYRFTLENSAAAAANLTRNVAASEDGGLSEAVALRDIVPGTYTLLVDAYDGDPEDPEADAAVIAHGSQESIVVSAGLSSAVSVSLQFLAEGSGSFSVTVQWPEEEPVQSVEYRLGEGAWLAGTIEGSTTVIGQSERAAGSFRLTIRFFDGDGELLATVDELVYVYNGISTERTVTLNGDAFTRPVFREVTFDAQGGSPLVDPQLVRYAHTANAPTDPVKPNQLFTGWFTEPTGGVPWNFDTDTILEDIILYAQWTTSVFTVDFDSQGGTAIDSQAVDEGETVFLPAPTPTRSGHAFVGWFTAAEGGRAWDFEADTVTEDLTLFARWNEVDSYEVITENGQQYAVLSYTIADVERAFTVPVGVAELRYLVIGGGGGGGSVEGSTASVSGGGGGSGGFVAGTISAADLADSAVAVIVGAGGAGAVPMAAGGIGGDSHFGAIRARGGGGGGSAGAIGGVAGASGGGAAWRGFGANGVLNQGNRGADARDPWNVPGGAGGGGGAGAQGSTSGGTDNGGDGGAGLVSDITGVVLEYAGGGGGGAVGSGQPGSGAAGAGSAPVGRGPGGDAQPNSGGGGGGASAGTSSSAAFEGGSGGSGMVIIRYALPE